MTNWLKNNVTDLEQSKRIAPIMERLGVEADGCWNEHGEFSETAPLLSYQIEGVWYGTQFDYAPSLGDEVKLLKIYRAARLDKLLSVLPESKVEKSVGSSIVVYLDLPTYGHSDEQTRELYERLRELYERLDELNKIARLTQGKQAISACVELIELLEKEGLLEEKNNE